MNIKNVMALVFFICISAVAMGLEVSFDVKDLRNGSGVVRIAVFSEDQKESFPKETSKAICLKNVRTDQQDTRITCEGIAAGSYAAYLLHDENDNGEMDHNWIRLPKEGYGFSNNASASFGLPDFEDAAFKLEDESIKQVINMNYMF